MTESATTAKVLPVAHRAVPEPHVGRHEGGREGDHADGEVELGQVLDSEEHDPLRRAKRHRANALVGAGDGLDAGSGGCRRDGAEQNHGGSRERQVAPQRLRQAVAGGSGRRGRLDDRGEEHGAERRRHQEDELEPGGAGQHDRDQEQRVVPAARRADGDEHRPDRAEEERVGEILAEDHRRVEHEGRERAHRGREQRAGAGEREAGDPVDRDRRRARAGRS